MLRPKKFCEVCSYSENPAILHYHHIIPRTDPNCTNTDLNVSILCPNCHNLVHQGDIEILGVYYTTDGLVSLWVRKGEARPIL